MTALAKYLKRRIGAWPLISLSDTGPFASLIKSSGHKVSAILALRENRTGGVVGLEAGDTTGKPPDNSLAGRAGAPAARAVEAPKAWVVALDIGSTHLAAALVDLDCGEELARANQLNPQTEVADDILSRIQKSH